MAFNELLSTKVLDDGRFMLTEPLVYDGNRERFEVPAGFITDFATVPRFLQWFVPSHGAYTRAAVLHDYLCTEVEHGRFNSTDADGVFRRVMRQERVPTVLRWFMWAGVRWGSVFNRQRRNGVSRSMPAVLGLSVLALPVVLPPSIAIAVCFLVYYVMEGFTAFVREAGF